MRRILIITLTCVLALFAYSVTLKYMPVRAAYTQKSRFAMMMQERPALLLIGYVNRELPDARIFQHYLDEYRVYWEIDCIGRRGWGLGYGNFVENYPRESAKNLHDWLRGFDRTHMIVASYGDFPLPIEDPKFEHYFYPEVVYGDYTLYRIIDSYAEAKQINTICLTVNLREEGIPSSWLQE